MSVKSNEDKAEGQLLKQESYLRSTSNPKQILEEELTQIVQDLLSRPEESNTSWNDPLSSRRHPKFAFNSQLNNSTEKHSTNRSHPK